MIAISADFDPVHKGHEQLIRKAREIADEKNIEVAIYMNKGYSANHAPFFTPFEARKEMALALGADKVIGVEGLHHRLILSYSVPIRLAKMHEDGVTDYITAADISLDEVKKYAERFIQEGSFLGMPQDFPNRNVIRWYAINEFLSKRFDRKIDFHLIPELTRPKKVSGRFIRKEILKNDLVISDDIKKLLPSAIIGAGGPEFGYWPEGYMKKLPDLDFVIVGEGEVSVLELFKNNLNTNIPGLYFRDGEEIKSGGVREPLCDLSELPFSYPDLSDPDNRIYYYESNRGCPFSCSYCMSSLDRKVRFMPLERVFVDLQKFLDARVKLVKFVDRTFNANNRYARKC